MKKILSLCLASFLLCGCATYKFQYGKSPYDKGYVASRDGYSILEYTIGKDNRVPEDVNLAKERFKRRRPIIEHYYKKMGYVENHFKMIFWNPPTFFLKAIGGFFCWPGIGISEYKYDHNPAYRVKVDQREEKQEAEERARLQALKEELNSYVQQDLTLEEGK